MYGLWLFKELKTEYGYCKIEIFKKSYSSSPIEIEAVEANSLTLSIENLSETISPIGKSVCSFSIVDTGQLSYDDFFTPDATGIKVVISTINEDRGDGAYTTRWSGFVTPDFYSESLVYRTAINISARDNIGYLSDVEFDLVEPTIQIRDLFSKAFTKISEQYPMDVMFMSHKTTEDGVLLTDAVISTALFKDKTWGEVLELILHDLGLQMRWIDNNIIAILDLSLLPEFFIPTDFNFVNSSGYREITPAYRQLSQKQDYGVIENFFNGQLNSDNLTFYKKINIATPLQTREEGYNSTLPTISYYTPNNWGVLMKETFTIQPTLYNLTFGDKIWFTGIEDARLFAYTHMSYEQSIHISNKPMTIKFSMLNTIQYPEYGTNKLTTYDPTVGLYIQTGDFLQLGLKCNCILHSEDNKTYILREKWVELSGLETTCIDFILPKVECTRSQGFINEGTAPVEKELTINIATIPANGILEFRIYGFYIVDKHNYWEDDFDLTKHEIDWTKCVTYIKGLTYTLDSEDISSSQTSVVTINDNHNIKRSEVYKFGEVPANEGAINAYAGGLFHPTTHLSLNGFKRNEDSPAYNLLELVGREIIHFNKKNYNKLSGEIKSPTKEPLKFNSLFSREGKLYYPFSCSLNVIDNTMTITSMQEVEPYTTESFTEIHSEVKSDGGTTVSGGNNTVLQYSEDAGNAKRLYEMQDATLAEKEKAFALVDSPDFPQARRIRVADLIGLDEQALAQYLELNKYLQENDLTPITNRIGAVEGYFTNGSAKDALKLGGIDAGNYWHKGNSGTLDYDWKAKKLNVRTLVIPTSEPTDLSEGEIGFYLGTAGQGAEEPNGSGGLDLTELWAELGSENYAKKIHISHIPTIQYSSIAGRPSALANPYALTINGVRYDGSEPISLDISAGGGVADAVAWDKVLNKPSTISGYGITDAYTKDSVDLKLSSYLLKSGGTISSSSVVPLTVNSTGDNTRIAFKQNGDTLGYFAFAKANTPLFIDNEGGRYTMFHSGNYSDYALPKSGGIVGDLVINATSDAFLQILLNGTSKALIGWQSNHGVRLYNYASASYLSIKDDGTPTYNGNTLYHTGNFNPNDYLAKSGGTMSGDIILPASKYIRDADNNAIFGYNTTQGVLVGTSYLKLSLRSSEDATINGNTLIHSGNIGSQSVNYATTAGSAKASDVYAWAKAATKPTYTASEVGALSTSGGTISGALTIKAYGYPLIEFKAGDITRGYYGFSGTGIAAIWDTKDWHTLIHSGNIGSQSVNYATNAGNAEKVAGLPVTSGNNNPWNSIPAITPGGYMDVGKHFEFHYDNTTGSDFSTILMCTGNYSNIVNLPSTSGTLALLTDNVASANYAGSAGNANALNGVSSKNYAYYSPGSGYLGFNINDFTLAPYGQGDGYIEYYDNGAYYNSVWGWVMAIHGFKGNADSATKLQTARTIWGQSFDGTGNVSGALSGVTNINSMLYINSSGNATVGSSDLAGTTTKLYVDGGLTLGGLNQLNQPQIKFSFNGEYFDLAGNFVFAPTSGSWNIFNESSANPLFRVLKNGNVLIGTTEDNGYKLDANGGISSQFVRISNGNQYSGLMPNNRITTSGEADRLWLYNSSKLALYGSEIQLYNYTIVWADAKINGEMDANALVIPTAPPTNPQQGKHYLYLA